MRVMLIVACALALGGCNLVFSEKPLFTAADSRGAPRLRLGVWMKPDKDCVFDRSQPVKAWPGCAGGMLVRADQLQDPAAADKKMAYLIAANNPPIFQVPFNEDAKKPGYMYGGMGIVRRDAQGRVIEFFTWIAQCGPPPPKPTNGDKPRYVTEHPVPGLKIDKESGMCIAVEPGPVRASVKASEAWNEDTRQASWVRDGEE
jgi:hypothetical protein